MSVSDLIGQLSSLGVRIKTEGDQLKIQAPKGVLTDVHKRELKKNKCAILRQLSPYKSEQGIVTGNVPMTPGLHRFLNSRNSPQPHHWNMAIVLQSTTKLDSVILQKVVDHLVSHHDALRIRFEQLSTGWQAFNTSADGVAKVTIIDMTHIPDADLSRCIEEHADRIQGSLDLEEPRMYNFTHFRTSDRNADRILVLTHHFVSDATSFTIILEDFQSMYSCLSRGVDFQPLPKTTSYKSWAQDLDNMAQSAQIKDSLKYWENLLWHNTKALPLDYPYREGVNTNASGDAVMVSLTVAETEALTKITRNDLRLEHVVQAAVARSICCWNESKSILMDVMGHGRLESGGQDLSRSVGFFISYTPVIVDPGIHETFQQSLQDSVNDISRMLERGIEHDLLRFVARGSEVKKKMTKLPTAEVLFNYLGRQYDIINDSTIDQENFQRAPESAGSFYSPRGTRYHALAIKAGIVNDKVSFTFVYSKNLHRTDTIQAIAHKTLEELRSVSSPTGA